MVVAGQVDAVLCEGLAYLLYVPDMNMTTSLFFDDMVNAKTLKPRLLRENSVPQFYKRDISPRTMSRLREGLDECVG